MIYLAVKRKEKEPRAARCSEQLHAELLFVVEDGSACRRRTCRSGPSGRVTMGAVKPTTIGTELVLECQKKYGGESREAAEHVGIDSGR